MGREVAEPYQGQPMLAFPDPAAWEKWLAAEHAGFSGLWLKLAKKGCPDTTVSYAEALDVALCFGWIDGQKLAAGRRLLAAAIHAAQAGQQVVEDQPRQGGSSDRGRPDAAGGLREVEAAKADGRWAAAYDGQSTATVPDDLRQALDQDEDAAAFFATLDRGNRYAILYRIHEAKKPETRAARIAKFVAMLHDHQTVHPVPARDRAGAARD